MAELIDLTGRRFGRLIVLANTHERRAGQLLWQVRCDCGTVKSVSGQNLRRGEIVSCGCYVRELAKARMTRVNTKHGKTYTPAWFTWSSMLSRCSNPESRSYPGYGGRGITVCARWSSFENFALDMGERPDGMTIERIDNDKGYEPGNCRWATMTEQNRNKRDTRKLTFDGRTMSTADMGACHGYQPHHSHLSPRRWLVHRKGAYHAYQGARHRPAHS